jgi:hypothetical protein
MKSRERSRSVVGLAVAAIFATPAWSAGEALEQGFLNPPSQAYPGGGIRINANADALRGQLERQKQLGIRQLSVGSEGAPGAYMSEPWKDVISSTVLAARQMGFEVTFMTSPGFSHTGDSQIQPQEAMKKLVWTETAVQGGQDYSGKLAAPPGNTGPFQNIPYFSESPWTIAIDRDFYRDIAVIAYKVPQPNTITAQPVVTSNQGPVDAARLSTNDPRQPLTIEGTPGQNGGAWLQLDYPRPQTVRSVVLATPETMFEESVVATLLARVDGTYRKVGTFDMRSIAQVTLSFPPVQSSSFRLEFSRLPQSVEPLVPKGGNDFAMNPAVLPFGPKRPPHAYAINALTLSSEGRVNEFERKAGYFTFVKDYYALATSEQAAPVATAKTDVIDLTDRMQAGGVLNWSPPAGQWRVLRVGYSLTGKINHPAPPDATGLEVDKLSATHMSKYINRYLDGLIPKGEARAGVRGLFADSIESGPQNWTDDMPAEFSRRRGYDMRPFFPALTGAVVQSASATDKFLWDYRQTIADLMQENTFTQLSEIAHARGLKVRVQALEQARHQLGDDFEMRRHADEPMGALWGSADPVLDYLKLYPNQVADQRGAASVAHVYGKSIVAAESGTTLAFPGAFSPRVLKQIVDLEFALGVNWLSQGAPTPGDTWAHYAQDWVNYLARSSYMLQQGRHVADVAYFYGQDAPLVALRERLDDAPLQHGYDYINTQALLHASVVKDGRLTTPGAEYRLLQLGGNSSMMTVNVLRSLRDLVQAGLIVAGAAPAGSPSLADSETEFRQIRAQLWGADGKGRKLGKGRVHGGPMIADVLATEGVAPDMTARRGNVGIKVGDTILFQHRKTDDADIYYVMNRGERAGPIEMSFRQTGRAPELWRADSGERTAVSYRIENGRTIVPIDLHEDDALFVVFRKATSDRAFTASRAVPAEIARLDGPWSVEFRGRTSGPVQMNAGSWTDNTDPGIKFHAGTATYSRTVNVPASALGNNAKVLLNLGEVQDIADVSVNGVAVGVRWTPPYAFDITPAVRPGDNKVEVKVTNRAVNGMIGAAQPKADGSAAARQPFGGYRPDAPLRASGLIGPVRLLRAGP